MKNFTISQLAAMVRKDWQPVDTRAEPYLSAMEHLNNISDVYMSDQGEHIVAYFLANALTWRGDLAKNVKKELNRRLMEK